MSISLEHIVFDTNNAAKLAEFYATVLEREVDPEGSEHFATVGRTGDNPMSPILMFMHIGDWQPGKNRMHFDLASPDYKAYAQRAIDAGATHVGDFDEYGTEWTTLKDPEGNVFDIGKGLG